MDAREFGEWIAYGNIEPFGAPETEAQREQTQAEQMGILNAASGATKAAGGRRGLDR